MVHVAARSDVDWESLPGELVVPTLGPPAPHPRIVVVQLSFLQELVRIMDD